MRNHYKAQKTRILQQLKASPIAGSISVRMEKEGLHFLLEVHGALEDADLIRRARQRGLRISCLSQYYRETPTASHVIVVNYAGLPSDRSQEAFRRLIGCIGDALKSDK